jgi:cell shape-determining protein MreD
MIRHRVLQLILLSIALLAQLSILPLMIKSVSSVNPLLALLLILSLKENRVEALLWGAFLGGLTDLLLFQHIGYHGISFVLLAYILGFISHKMVIHGVIPTFMLSVMSFLMVFGLTVGLVNLLQGGWDFSLLAVPLFLGIIFTPILTLLFNFLYQRLDRFLTQR